MTLGDAIHREAEAAGYIHLDDPERDLLATVLMYASSQSAFRAERRVILELRERVHRPYATMRLRPEDTTDA